ncbi:hypothetical protein [Terriglobus saanensis]|uniref:Uncharacterized protein n=1 Tax=Terriglobus saanensis (strain ATCC BAA-1853 / DSM 23119 / SP1PR4) TaxID=401053 RepID=E8V2V7_TERSS|nr:hypothetical protein [Terriglobus saanensis]ADV84654.1 hypothetical protein AciPR4_3905 [Terriglobus saanensis SP1PR4]
MKILQAVAGLALAGALVTVPVHAQAPASVPVATQDAGRDVSNSDLVMMTVHEAWLASGRNEDRFFDMVKRLAEMSAQKRGLALSETEAAGSKAGDWIKKQARKDPDQLLYAVVDSAVKHTGMMKKM